MSTAVDARRRPSLWSYLSFSSPPRRRSVSLPTRSNSNSYDKDNRRRNAKLEYSNEGWMTQSQRSRYLKTGGVLAFILFLLYILAPNHGAGIRDVVKGVYIVGWLKSAAWANCLSTGGQMAAPRAETTKCSKSYSSDKPLIQYALMIDAGSTGSRIHVYKFNNCGPTPELEDEEFKMTEKKEGGSGLSSYKTDAEGAAKSLDMLMDVAVKTVPEKYQSCSPVAVKATAGLRRLGPEMSDKILAAVRNRLETAYPFPVVEENGVQIMDGKDEGVYAWITTNYLLGKIGGPDKSPTAAIFDLGGGSTQIVFEPTFKAPSGGMPEKLQEGDHKYALNFGGREFQLYQHSHLGYGLMTAREAIHKKVVQTKKDAAADNDPSWHTKPIQNPCLAAGTSRDVKVTLEEGSSEISVTMVGPTEGSPAQCRAFAEKILEKDAPCALAPCSFKGVHQPSLAKTFAQEDVYIFSYFYDRTFPLGMPESFTLAELRDITAKVCEGKSGWGVFESVEGALEELKDRPEWCLDLNFMVALLHTGYEMPSGREVRIAKKIKGNELGWCLGAR